MELPIADDEVDKAPSVDRRLSVDAPGFNFATSATGGGDDTPSVADENTSALTDQIPPQPLSNGNVPQHSTSQMLASHFISKGEHPHNHGPDVPVQTSLTNGDNVSNVGSDDFAYQNSAAGDNHAGSDTDNSRSEHILQPKDIDDSHTRSNSTSVKKPTSFKAVSVTKNYLAKTGVSAVQSIKGSSDKSLPNSASSTPVQLAARPRLVAKSGSKDARTLSGGPSNSGTPTPDASTVWNRNRPVAPPPPKQFTDEELKQQYGIHMANRLQADEAGQNSKWADLDDDDDDWAPETVEWMDGTKSTIHAKDSTAQASTQTPQNTAATTSEQLDSSEKADGARGGSVSTAGKAILRPGARTSTSTIKPGLILKSVPETPTTESKPAPPQSSNKSPWAALPPVDKASLIAFNPPQQAAPNPMENDMPTQEHQQMPQIPAKEIAADDFNRSIIEHDRPVRDLYNPQSGRYEPARGGARRHSRTEAGGFRAPEVLQRPSQRPGDRPTWTAQQSPSHEIGESATQHAPVVSSEPPPDDARAAADANSTSSTDPTRVDAPRAYSALGPRGQQGHPGTAPTNEDDLALQQKLMREKIEFNKRRKQEEEEREKLARQERIKARLDALGPVAPKVDKSKDHEVTDGAEKDGIKGSTETVVGTGTPSMIKDTPMPVEQPLKDLGSTAAPSASGTTIQPRPQNTGSNANLAGLATSTSSSSLQSKGTAPSARRPVTGPTSSSQKGPSADSPAPTDSNMESKADSFPETSKSQSLAPSTASDRHGTPSWTSPSLGGDSTGSWSRHPLGGLPNPLGNVWGPPTNDKTLGNGAFESNFQRLGSMPPSQQSASQPGPIGPPVASSKPHTDQPRASPVSSPAFDLHKNDMTHGAPFGYSAQGQRQPAPADGIHRPFANRPNQRRTPPSGNNAVRNAWGNFAGNLMEAEKAAAHEAYRVRSERIAEQERSGAVPRLDPSVFEGSQSNAPDSTSRIPPSVNTVQSTTVPEKPHPSPSVQLPIGQVPPNHNVANNRPSRFFGPADKVPFTQLPLPAIQHQQLAATGRLSEPPTVASVEALPPDQSGKQPSAEACDDLFSDNKSVSVKLPPLFAKVKLPPATPTAPATNRTVIMPTPPRPFGSGAQAIVNQAAWQDRFNGLLKSTPRSPPQARSTPAIRQTAAVVQPSVIQSSSAAPLETALQSATVSLPRDEEDGHLKQVGFALPNSHSQSKHCVEDLMDDRELGSTPPVHIPQQAVYDNMPRRTDSHDFYENLRLGKFGTPMHKRIEALPEWSHTAQAMWSNDSYRNVDQSGRHVKNTTIIINLRGRRIMKTMSSIIPGMTSRNQPDRSNPRRRPGRSRAGSTSNSNSGQPGVKKVTKPRTTNGPVDIGKAARPNGLQAEHATPAPAHGPSIGHKDKNISTDSPTGTSVNATADGSAPSSASKGLIDTKHSNIKPRRTWRTSRAPQNATAKV